MRLRRFPRRRPANCPANMFKRVLGFRLGLAVRRRELRMSGTTEPDLGVGDRPLPLVINRYGMDPRARYGNAPRTHNVDVIRRRSTEELYGGIRGACFAIYQAHHEGNRNDLKLALIRNQLICAQLVKRASDRPVHITYKDIDYFPVEEDTQ